MGSHLSCKFDQNAKHCKAISLENLESLDESSHKVTHLNSYTCLPVEIYYHDSEVGKIDKDYSMCHTSVRCRKQREEDC
jgi:hypothetical protein